MTDASSSFIVETDIETVSHVDNNTETDMRILDEQPTEEASQIECQSNNGSLHSDDNSIETVEESSNNNNVNDKSNVFESYTGIFNLKDKNLPPKFVKIRPNTTELQILSQTIAIAMRHKLTYEATLSIFKLIKSITSNSNLPSTKKSLWRALLRNDDLATVRHFFCRICQSNLGTEDKPDQDCKCGASGPDKSKESLSYFIQLNLKSQLKNLFSKPKIFEDLQYRYNRKKENVNAIEDIYDGIEYKKMCEPNGFLAASKNNFSFFMNVDGMKLSKSSNASAWPILFTINELPPHARKKHILLGGIWVENFHPYLNMFLMPTIKELRSLYKTGIAWKPDGNNEITSRFVTLICPVDSVARASLLNMTQFNGEFGCTFCYSKGEVNDFTRTYPIEKNAPSRTHDEIRQDMIEAHESQSKVRGVKGISSLIQLKELDLSKGVVVDSTHNIFMGVVKQHTELLLFGRAIDPWYRGSPRSKTIINRRLKQIKIPSRISRYPRKIDDCKNWKASEWRNWLLYYCIYCLKDIIRQQDLDHLKLLSEAAFLLHKSSITTDNLHTARDLFYQYIQNFQETFGKEKMTYNIHLLNHLSDTAENWGPLWANSCFPFESFNKKIAGTIVHENSIFFR